MLRQFLIDNILITYEKSKTRRYPDITTRCISEDEITDKYKKYTFGNRNTDQKFISMLINFDISIEDLLSQSNN